MRFSSYATLTEATGQKPRIVGNKRGYLYEWKAEDTADAIKILLRLKPVAKQALVICRKLDEVKILVPEG